MLAWMGLIFTLSSLSADTIEQVSPPPQWPLGLVTPSFVHTGEYAVLAVLAYRVFRSYSGVSTIAWFGVVAVTVVYAASDELHQSFVPGRDPSLADLGYDCLGGSIGLAAAELLRRYLARVM